MRAFVGNLESDAPLHPTAIAARPSSLQDAESVVNELLRLWLWRPIIPNPIAGTRASRASGKGGEELTRDPRPLEERIGAIEGAASAAARRRGWHGIAILTSMP